MKGEIPVAELVRELWVYSIQVNLLLQAEGWQFVKHHKAYMQLGQACLFPLLNANAATTASCQYTWLKIFLKFFVFIYRLLNVHGSPD